jgi:hypothetical protein
MFEDLLAQAQELPVEERVYFIQRLAETLLPCHQAVPRKGPGLLYGAYPGPKMSTEEDFN